MSQSQLDSFFSAPYNYGEATAPSKIISDPTEMGEHLFIGIDRLGNRYRIEGFRQKPFWIVKFQSPGTVITFKLKSEPTKELIMEKLYKLGYVFNKNLSLNLQGLR